VLEYDGTTGQVLRWYAYGLGSNAVLGQMDVVAGTRTMPIPDLLGSVIASVDAGTGTISKSGYLPYGSGTPATPFGFTGQRLVLKGTSDTNTVALTDGNGMQLAGTITLGLNDTLEVFYDENSYWTEISRSNN